MFKKIVLAGISFSFFAVPMLATADAISDLQAQLQMLMAQIQTLQTSQTTNTTVSSSDVADDYGTGSIPNGIYCPKLTTTLQKGSRDVTTGGQVSELQTFLTDYFNLDENIVVGGYFGNLTHSYVVKFQQTHGLPSLGIVGSLTRAKISAVCGGTATPIPEAAVPVIKISASPATVSKGGTSIVSWSTQNATRCWMHHGDANGTQFEESIATQGQKQFNPYVTYKVTVGCANEQNLPKDGPQSSSSVIITVSEAANGITVTAPNGGEQWEIGQLNTITWSPYSYNPDSNPAKDVNVFLERLDGTTVGQVMDTGKASLHTYFNIGGYNSWAEPGQYRIYVANRVTGATDRSDAPFTLLPRPVDLKVNGSNGPITLSEGQAVTLSWSSPTGSVCSVSGVRDAGSVNSTATSNGQTGFNSLPASSSGFSAVFIGTQYAGSIYMTCALPDGRSRTDSVGVNPGTVMTSLKVIYPNGRESFDPNKQMTITLNQTGLKSVSIALYKNDQWKYWIAKDIQPANTNWIPAASLQGLGEGDNAGAIWKIYITGQKADGSGYIDDKSDEAFSFVAPTASNPSCTVTTNKTSYSLGETITAKWVSTNASYANWAQDTSGKDALKLSGDKLEISGSQQILASVIGNPTIVLRVTNASGQTNTCSTAVTIGPPAIDSSADIKFNGQDSAITVHVGDAPFQMNFTTKNVYSCTVTVMGPMPSGPSSFPTSYSGPSGAIVVGLVGATNFLFSCTTPSGGLVSDSIQMTVLPPASAATNSGTDANLASALTALQSVLEKLVAELSQ